MAADEPIRFTDVLTTAAAVADYLAAPAVVAEHLVAAIAILRGERSYDDLGRGRVPLGHRPPGGAPVAPAVRELVQRWFHALGDDAAAELPPAQLARLVSDLESVGDGPAAP